MNQHKPRYRLILYTMAMFGSDTLLVLKEIVYQNTTSFDSTKAKLFSAWSPPHIKYTFEVSFLPFSFENLDLTFTWPSLKSFLMGQANTGLYIISIWDLRFEIEIEPKLGNGFKFHCGA